MNVLFRLFFSKQVVLGTARFCATLLLVSACIEPYLPPLIESPNGILVVDGFLVANDSSVIKLSRTTALNDVVSAEPERGASVEIESENGNKYTLINKNNGMYVAPPLDLDPSDNYRLHIRTGDTYEYLSDYVPLKQSPLLDSVTWKEEQAHDRIEFNVYSHDPLNKTHYYLWTYDETWKYVSKWRSVYYYESGNIIPRKSADELYECWKTNKPKNIYLNSTNSLSQDVVYNFPLFSIPQTSRKLYFGYSILVKQFALTP
ncbi:MAG: DUF4249 domain-containing protein, partial [Marivirga sp.]|nr:DUF4249 domain-containing protein [Marivirga sp.]